MQENIKKQHIKKEVRLSHIEKWRQSGLSMSAYAREVNLPISSLSNWVRSENKSKEKFKPISLSPIVPINPNNTIEIIINK